MADTQRQNIYICKIVFPDKVEFWATIFLDSGKWVLYENRPPLLRNDQGLERSKQEINLTESSEYPTEFQQWAREHMATAYRVVPKK